MDGIAPGEVASAGNVARDIASRNTTLDCA